MFRLVRQTMGLMEALVIIKLTLVFLDALEILLVMLRYHQDLVLQPAQKVLLLIH